VAHLLSFVGAGVQFVFGPVAGLGFSLFTNVLPIIIFMGTLTSVLYHFGVLQRIVDFLALLLARSMGLSGAESLAAVSNVFLGLVESALVIKPYVAAMTRSELFSLMTLGMGTVAGSVLVAYAGFIGESKAAHLVVASLLSAPAGLLVAKVMEPELETPATGAGARISVERETVNVIDAAASGALSGLRLAASVGALLLAFVALMAMANALLGGLGGYFGFPELSFQQVLGWALAPLALLMGVPYEDAAQVGSLLGIKTILNEFIAYQALGVAASAGALQERSVVIASYALCGFANFGTLAILLGGIGGIAPQRRGDIAALGLRSIIAGSLTTFMTACLAGLLL